MNYHTISIFFVYGVHVECWTHTKIFTDSPQ